MLCFFWGPCLPRPGRARLLWETGLRGPWPSAKQEATPTARIWAPSSRCGQADTGCHPHTTRWSPVELTRFGVGQESRDPLFTSTTYGQADSSTRDELSPKYIQEQWGFIPPSAIEDADRVVSIDPYACDNIFILWYQSYGLCRWLSALYSMITYLYWYEAYNNNNMVDVMMIVIRVNTSKL